MNVNIFVIRNVADELRIFESINHPHLINHFGVEIHREEMLIFMEYCPEVNIKFGDDDDHDSDDYRLHKVLSRSEQCV